MGELIYIQDDGAGGREAIKVLNADAAKLVEGNYGVAYKVSPDTEQVLTSTANQTITGDRIVTIASGDAMIEVRRGALVEYTADLLDDSLNPANSGTTPVVGVGLEILGSKFCAVGEASAITAPIVASVYRVFGTNVVVEII